MSDKKQQEIALDIPLYEHLATFLGVDKWTAATDKYTDVVILGIPFDLTTPGRPGSRFAPGAIRLASANLRWDVPRWPWNFEILEAINLRDGGDIHCQTGTPETMVKLVKQQAKVILSSGSRLLSIGGDHYVSLPLLRAHYERYGPMALIHFDSHTDTYDGPKFDNGTVFHHAVMEGLIIPEHSIQIGIRTAYIPEGYRFTVLDADWIINNNSQTTLERIKSVVGDRPTYLTFDIDCLDPAYAPGTGTPVVGGFSTNFALQVIRGLGDIDLVGMDLVEVSPPFDTAEITSLAGATIALEVLHVWAYRKLS